MLSKNEFNITKFELIWKHNPLHLFKMTQENSNHKDDTFKNIEDFEIHGGDDKFDYEMVCFLNL